MSNPKTIQIGANTANPYTLNRLGYGTMRLTGEGFYGEPKNRDEALRVLKRAIDAGINYIDTADFYGPGVTNRLIAEALHPYKNDLVIGTKVGAIRGSDKSWNPYSKPDELRKSIDNNLKELKQDQITLVHYRFMPAHEAHFDESVGAMFDMQKEGKIIHVGLSNVSRTQLEKGMGMGNIASVQNLYGYHQRTTLAGHMGGAGGEEILDILEQNGIPLIPYFSLHTSLNKGEDKIEEMAKKYNVSPAQMNIAWLLHKSPVMLPIPGTTSVAHLEENIKAADIEISDEDMAYLG
ncbi:aldo/keto reductase [Mucilaginibacter ginkgonis]|uniref:Aldo/keto reductase n=1 Tax=Mucilaginibacter ginkgonis TaxID=2682091 RepID=A0A7T7FAJ0_9SPHI|nr:aldo/keto reductase [Mucilaginibacter ginkgonis]QQL49791.1 aldo/keto reductase [Mucilaginibacter ginkgonis]